MTKSRSVMAGLVPAIHDCHAREGGSSHGPSRLRTAGVTGSPGQAGRWQWKM